MRLALPLVLLAAALAGASPAPASLPAGVTIEPELLAVVSRGPAPALFTFDERVAGRDRIAAHLADRGVDAYLFERVDVGVACAGSMADLRTLAEAPGTRYVSANHALTPATDTSVPTAFNRAPRQVWEDLGVTGRGVGIAILDTGLDATHPDLELGRRTKANVRVLFSHREAFGPGSDGCVPDTYTDDLAANVRQLTGAELPPMEDTETTSGHGTHIAGVAAGDGTASGGHYRGMAPGADLVGVAVTDTLHANPRLVDPTTGYDMIWPSTLGAVAGINYVLIHATPPEDDQNHTPVAVVKVVLAGWTQDILYDPWSPLGSSLHDLWVAGINVVFPAGNHGPAPSDCSAAETCRINTWVASPFSIGVAAAPRGSRSRLEEYSSRGDPFERIFDHHTTDPLHRSGYYQPDVTAPGTGVVATRRMGLSPFVHAPGSIEGSRPGLSSARDFRFDRHHQVMSGTSVAAAHVAGTVALMQQASLEAKSCYLSPRQVQQIVRDSATPMPGYAEHQVGAGMLDATAAVHMARSAPVDVSPPPWRTPRWLCPA